MHSKDPDPDLGTFPLLKELNRMARSGCVADKEQSQPKIPCAKKKQEVLKD